MLKKAVIIIGSTALLLALPVLANKSNGQTASHVQAVRVCLKDAADRLQEDSEAVRTAYLQKLEDTKMVQKNDVKAAWDQREAAIKAGRVSITRNDDKGQAKDDVKAERKVFEAAKSKAEAEFEAAKKTAAEKRRLAAQAAKNEWIAARTSLRSDYLSAKEICKK